MDRNQDFYIFEDAAFAESICNVILGANRSTDNMVAVQQEFHQVEETIVIETEQDELIQLHQLLTPQQQLEQQQQQQQLQQQQYMEYYPTTSTPSPDATAIPLLSSEDYLQQPVQQLQAPEYDYNFNPYAQRHAAENQNYYPNHDSQHEAVPSYNPSYANANGSANDTTNGKSSSRRSLQQPRKKRATKDTTNGQKVEAEPAEPPGGESVQNSIIEECRKMVMTLTQHRDIEYRRLQLDARKVALMEEYLEKIVDMQSQILEKFSERQ